MTTPQPKPIPEPPPVDVRPTVRVTSAQLFAGGIEVQIDHFGAIYRLKQTALGKLILTK